MYTDASRNPLTAMQGVDLLLAPVLQALSAPPVPRRFQYDTGVSIATYNRLIEQYNELVTASERALLSVRLRAIELEAQNLRLRAELARARQR